MSELINVMQRLSAAGIFVFLDQGKLKTRCDAHCLTPELVSLIKANKDGLVDYLSRHAGSGAGVQQQITARGSRCAPLSFAQQRLWLLDRIDGGSAHYNMPNALRLSGALDVAALERAFAAIVARHESLRTVFAVGADGEPEQRVQPAAPVPVPVVDLAHLPPAAREQAVMAQVNDDAARPFQLAQDLMLRVTLLRLAADEHILLVTLHHIAADGWSIALLINEFGALYRAFALGADNPLPPLAIQYADYAHWQRHWLQGEVLDQQLGYWTRQLAGLPVVHSLPLDFPRPPQQTFHGALHHSVIDAATCAALQALCLGAGATLFMGLHAAVSVLLARYSNETDIVLATPIANREQPEVAGLIGFFVNTLVLRSDLSGNPAFAQLLDQSRRMLLDAYAHQQVPFEQLVERLQPPRSSSHGPLYQVMLILQNNEEGTLELPALGLSAVPPPATVAKCDLTINMTESAAGLALDWGYNTDLFGAATIGRMAAHFEVLLKALVAAPALPVFSAPMLLPGERLQLASAAQAGLDGVRDVCLHALFEATAARTPDAIAVRCGDDELSFAALNARANQLAHHLASHGYGGADRLVAICLERSLDTVVAILAIMKAGAAYVPLDPAYPPARLAYMLDDARPGLVLTQRRLRPLMPADALCLDDPQWLQQRERYPSHNLAAEAVGVGPGHLAYVIYTSGSTGQPKGVMQTHRTIANLVQVQALADGIDRPLRTLQFASGSFDVSVQEIATAWHTGGTLLMLSEESKRDLARLPDLLQAMQVERAFLPPAVLHWLAEALEDSGKRLPALREVFAAGEALLLSAPLRRFMDRHPDLALWNHYGPTETHVATRHLVLARDAAVPIGRPVPHLQAWVLNAAFAPVPPGVAGELLIGGAGLARGYLNRPELDAEKFIVHQGQRLYRTGDLVRWLPDGTLDYLGRMDHQVKIRGFRIELGEIEAALARHPAVSDAVVVAHTPAAGGTQLLAYVVAAGATGEGLRAHLAGSLPDFMLPAAFIWCDAFPLNPNGKVDRKALPAPDAAAMQAAYVAPRNAIERTLCGIWQELLGVERVGATDNFFQLGGHSLSATRLAARINQAFDVALPIKAIFGAQTLEQLALAVAQLEGGPGRPPLVPAARRADLLPSYAQQRLWMLDQIDGGGGQYNMPGALRLAGQLDVAALRRAFATLVERHESLRTCFRAGPDGQPFQVIQPAPAFEVPLVDLAGLMPGERSARVAQLVAEEAGRGFDLGADLMLRTTLLRLAPEEHIVLLTMHHIASDGWSMAILVNEFSALYGAYAAGAANPLPPLPLQYADYAHWQRNWLQGAVLDAQLDYWSAKLAGLPVVHSLPLDRARPALQTFDGAVHATRLDAASSDALRALCQRAGATLFMGLHAAFAVLLARWSNETDIVVGSPIANREQAEVAGLIGFFVNTLVLRSDLSGEPSFASVLAQSKRTLLDAYAHQQVSFDQIVERLQPERSLAHSPLFQVMLVLQNNETGTLALPGLTLSEVEQEGSVAKYDLTLNVNDGGVELGLEWGYNTDLFEAATIARMSAQFCVLLGSLLRAPDASVFSADMLPEPERRQLAAWQSVSAPYPEASTIHALFEAQAARRPDAVALVFDGQHIGYGELNARANRLAHYLVAQHGVLAQRAVGVLLPPSPELIVALLAILKAGGAYLPLDPSYPAARLAFMLHDAAPVTVITRRSALQAAPLSGAQALLLDDAPEAALPCVDRAEGASGPDHLAYILYTSGSTGNPKGVLVEHRAVVSLVVGNHYVPLSADTVMLQNAPAAFDAATFEIWGALLHGGQLVIRAGELDTLGPLMQAHGVNTAWMTSGLFDQFAGHFDGALPALDYLLVGGDVVNMHSVQAFRRKHPGVTLINGYGPTENTTFSCCYAIPDDLQRFSAIPIGRPLANRSAYVLDAALRQVPLGVAGELHVGGAGLARAYLNRPDLTAEKFIANPFHDARDAGSSARLYKTGDLVRWRADGTLDYLGRIDQQVKIRGFRIELGEIEHALGEHAQVQEAAVLATPDKRLVAYVAGTAEPHALRQHLAARLPEYMVPSLFVPVDALPLTPNGKVDRKALPAPAPAQEQPRHVAPRTDAEKALCAIWQEVLGVERLGVTDNFFGLGGHSLLALQLVSQARRRLGAELSLRTVFVAPTVEEMAAALGGAAHRSSLVAVRPQGAAQAAPLFLVHPGEGEIGYAHDLAPFLEPDLPVYGLAASGFLEGEAVAVSVEAMASRYVEAIRQVQPQGPYRLAGWSAGGTIAYDMARQLKAAGQGVSFLGLIDTSCDYRPGRARPLPLTGEQDADDAAYILEHLPAGTPAAQVAQLTEMARAGAVLPMLERCREAGMFPAALDSATLRRYLAVRAAISRALDRYVLRPIGVPLSLFRAGRGAQADLAQAWQPYADAGLEHCTIDGDHYSIMAHPAIAALGAALSEALLAEAK